VTVITRVKCIPRVLLSRPPAGEGCRGRECTRKIAVWKSSVSARINERLIAVCFSDVLGCGEGGCGVWWSSLSGGQKSTCAVNSYIMHVHDDECNVTPLCQH